MKKTDIKNLHISDYFYDLPEVRIAKYPLAKRDESKLLIYSDNQIFDSKFKDIDKAIPEGSLLIYNNTKVIHARLLFKKDTGANIEIFCLSPHQPADYAENFQQNKDCTWTCLVGNAKRWHDEVLTLEVSDCASSFHLFAKKIEKVGQEFVVHFSWDNSAFTFSEVIEMAGNLPIPPYLNRETEESDNQTYQTVYSKIEGSVAAPTAGLHFTEDVFKSLDKKKISFSEVTLHVGAGTFRPVKSESIGEHEMHTEFITISRETINSLLQNKGKLIVVGTTSMRTIESLYEIGRKIIENPQISPENLAVKQWDPYDFDIVYDSKLVLEAILKYLDNHQLNSLTTSTQIMIAPGYKFKFADGLITNFHQPQSTLLLLISAFVGGNWRKVYNHALQNDYRFLSYGDASLLWIH